MSIVIFHNWVLLHVPSSNNTIDRKPLPSRTNVWIFATTFHLAVKILHFALHQSQPNISKAQINHVIWLKKTNLNNVQIWCSTKRFPQQTVKQVCSFVVVSCIIKHFVQNGFVARRVTHWMQHNINKTAYNKPVVFCVSVVVKNILYPIALLVDTYGT